MKNTLKRDARAKGGGGGDVVLLSNVRLASSGKTAGNGARKGDPAPTTSMRVAPRSGEALAASLPEKRAAVRKSLRAAAKARARRGTRRMSPEKVIKESQRWLNIIANANKLSLSRKKKVVKETVKSFDAYFNSGFLEYRKAVAEAEQYAAVEWTGQGSYIEDIMGRKYIDCLGGFGIYSAGVRHPKIIEAVRNQLDRMPPSSQELLDPLRGALAELLGEIAPGNLQKCFFINNGTDAVEGAMKLARLYTEKSGFISTIRGFHGKSYGSLSLMGKAEYRVAFEPLLQDVYFVEFGDADEVEWQLKKARDVGLDIAAVVAEPVQGEAGAVEALPGQAAQAGEYLLAGLRDIQSRFPEHVADVRGKGLLIGMEFDNTEFGYSVASGLFRRGVLVAGTLLNAKTIRIEPALSISRKLMDEVLTHLDDTLRSLS